jgi:tRNA modification GTPase
VPLGDTIVAIASPPGRAARGIVRLSGAATREVLAAATTGPVRPFERGCFVSALRLEAGVLPVLVCTYRGPRSYTGEDSAEILFPGNPRLADRVVEVFTRFEGVRMASPGEFSARAYLNERLTLDQAEGVAAVIAAATGEELAAAHALRDGATGAMYRRWADEVATLLALVEAGIDFSDQEDVVAIEPRALAARAGSVEDEITTALGGPVAAEARSHLPRVVLVGRPNAGKSTLFNSLLGRRRAVVSPLAGTTRDALEEELDLTAEAPGAGRVLLIDLAGIGDGGAGIDGAAQEAAGAAIAGADVAIQCDPTGRFEHVSMPGSVIRVRTKADLAGGPQREGLAVCALNGWNLPTLRRAIADAAWGAARTGPGTLLARHRRALDAARAALNEARNATAADLRTVRDPALVASNLRSALDALGELVGRISPDDVIGRIFATFCVGK